MLVGSIDNVGYGVANLSQDLFVLPISFSKKVLLDLEGLLLAATCDKFVLTKSEFFKAEFPRQTPKQLARDDSCPSWAIGGENPLGEFFGQIVSDSIIIQAVIAVGQSE